MLRLGDIVEFESSYWKGRIFGKIDIIYLNQDREPIEYWVDHIDNSNFTPAQYVRTLEAGTVKMPKIKPAKFKAGDLVTHNDGDKTWVFRVTTAQYRIEEKEQAWLYDFKGRDMFNNDVGWNEEIEESELKRFKV